MYYLYIKQHNKTKFNYLGYTQSLDPYKYSGSGKQWLQHLKHYGYDFTTFILLATEDRLDLLRTAIFFSNFFKVTKSKHWANLKEETLDGGWDYVNNIINKTEKRKKQLVDIGTKLGKSNKNTVSVRDSEGRIFRVPESEFKDKKDILVGHTKGKSFLYDEQGNMLESTTSSQKEGFHGNNYGKIFITDGHQNKMVLKNTEIPQGWRIGISETKNKHNSGKIWINNNYEEKMVLKTLSIPQGWSKGRIKKNSE